MADKHEIRIIAKDFTKIVCFDEDYGNWEDMYHSAGAVIDDEPDQFIDGDTVVGQIETDLEYAEVIRIMVEEAGLMGEECEVALKSHEEKVIFNE